MLEVARFYEKNPKNYEKAIHLFFKAGHVARAIDMCFQSSQFHILGDLVSSLSKEDDPRLLHRCAAFFFESGDYQKSVNLLILSGDYYKALEICIHNNIIITEEMANQMNSEDESDKTKALLNKIAECCVHQRSFLLACKKYTQSGERMKAMKALLQSGDTEKIIFFANALGSKQKEIFVLVANYLQTLDWRNEASVMKAIISFYTKARAMDSLSNFYESCCHVEIDEFQNYEKGMQALKEGLKCLEKVKDSREADFKSRNLKQKLEYINLFIEAKSIAKNDYSNTRWSDICESLLSQPSIDDSVKIGDIYALMIESHFNANLLSSATTIFQRMKHAISSTSIEYYLDPKIIISIGGKVGYIAGEDQVHEDFTHHE